jgi:hypothetical protein
MVNDISSSAHAKGQLIVEPEAGREAEALKERIDNSIDSARNDLLSSCSSYANEDNLIVASDIIRQFKPVPWFIWRLTNYVFSQNSGRKDLPEGFVLGLRRLLFAAASDPALGSGEKVNSLRIALETLAPCTIAAITAIHGICRKLVASEHERLWRPVLDDALIRARIGYLIGKKDSEFTPGKGMLAGFVGSAGLAVMFASSSENRASAVLEMVAKGTDVGDAADDIYGCHSLIVGAMLLSAIGCGSNAASGVMASLSSTPHEIINNNEQAHWLAATDIVEAVRTGASKQVPSISWRSLGIELESSQQEIVKNSKKYIRNDHGLHWLV